MDIQQQPGLKLSARRRIFCEEYVRHWNGTKAAITAGYSKRSARGMSWQLLKKDDIKEYIESLKTNLEETVGISKQMVLEEYIKLAFHNMDDLHDTWIERKEFEKLTRDQKAAIQVLDVKVQKKNVGTAIQPDIVDVEHVHIKLYDKVRALDAIKKMLGYDAPTKMDVTTKGRRIGLLSMSDEELQSKVDELKSIPSAGS